MSVQVGVDVRPVLRELAEEHVRQWFRPESVPRMLQDDETMAHFEASIARELGLSLPGRRGAAAPAPPRRKTPIPQELRWAVFERDGFTCRTPGCGSRRFLQADHVVAESRGGPTTLDNLQTLCRSCNARKGAR